MKLSLIGAAVLVLATIFTANPGTTIAATTLNVNVGGGANSIAANGFLPKSITIHQGDTIHFTSPSSEPHTTTFVPSGTKVPDLIVPGPSGPPQFTFSPQAANPTFSGSATPAFDSTKYFNSGIMFKDSTLTLSFPKTGTFQFLCLFHATVDASGTVHGMKMDVKVVSSGTTADTQSALDTRAQSELTSTLAAGEAGSAAAVPAASEKLADGSTKIHVIAGAETAATSDVDADVMRFLPQTVNINVGDTVEWSNHLDVPHTITFGTGGTIPSLAVPLPQPSGPPLLELNPAVFAPGGATEYDGTGMVNSGAIGEGFAGTSTSLKFTKAGTYTYLCLIHADQGMKGTITIAAAATAPPATGAPGGISAPNTGSGPERGSELAGFAGALALVLVGASLVLAGARRKQLH